MRMRFSHGKTTRLDSKCANGLVPVYVVAGKNKTGQTLLTSCLCWHSQSLDYDRCINEPHVEVIEKMESSVSRSSQ